MKIAQVAPLAESVPPKLYGGTERVVSWLTEDLVRRGHKVTLFASGDSETAAELVSITPRALRLDPTIKDPVPYHLIMLDQVLARAADFDVIHFHVDLLHFPTFRGIGERTLTTLHGQLGLSDLQPFYRHFPEMPLVSISHSQRVPMPQVNWLGTVHHGMPADLYTPDFSGGDYLAFLGRVSPEKGIEAAMDIAERTQTRLKIAAKIDNADRSYFEARVKPRLDSEYIEFVGEVNDSNKNEFLGGARALLFPIAWPEPFGIVMIEAMACGTPVIAFNCGSVPEVLEHGVTGLVVNGIDEAVAATHCVVALDRRAIRRHFEQRFTVDHMSDKYLEIYRRLLDSRVGAMAAA